MRKTAWSIGEFSKDVLETASPSSANLVILGAVTATSLIVAGDVLSIAFRAAKNKGGEGGIRGGLD